MPSCRQLRVVIQEARLQGGTVWSTFPVPLQMGLSEGQGARPTSLGRVAVSQPRTAEVGLLPLSAFTRLDIDVVGSCSFLPHWPVTVLLVSKSGRILLVTAVNPQSQNAFHT